MTTPRAAAQIAISIAGLTAATERNAMRLLARAAEDTGGLVVTQDALCKLFGVCNPAVTRRHLGLIQAAGIIHYSTNQYVYINFLAWPARVDTTETVIQDHLKRAPTRAEDTEPTENNAPQRAPDLLKARVGATESARGRAHGGDNRGGRLVGNSLLPSQEKKLPTNQPVDADAPRIIARPFATLQTWEPAASESLLLEMGCENLPALRTVARSFAFEEIRAHALAYQRDARVQGPGGLINRIRSGDFATPELTDDDRRNSLFLRHRTPSEIAADAERQAQAAEENRLWDERQRARDAPRRADADAEQAPQAAVPVALAAGRTPADIWTLALADLQSTMPAPTYETWVRDTNVLRYEDGEFVIGVPHAYARDWLSARLRPQIKHILSRLTKRSTEVTFAVRPRPNPNGDQPCVRKSRLT